MRWVKAGSERKKINRILQIEDEKRLNKSKSRKKIFDKGVINIFMAKQGFFT